MRQGKRTHRTRLAPAPFSHQIDGHGDAERDVDPIEEEDGEEGFGRARVNDAGHGPLQAR